MASEDRLHTRQYLFLKELRNSAEGFPDHLWPRLTTLRKWLRHPGFRAALKSLQTTMRFERDWMMAASASRAAKNLHVMLSEQDPRNGLAEPDLRLASLVRIVRAEQLQQKAARRPQRVRSKREEQLDAWWDSMERRQAG